jgi:hypothetical protein
MAEEVTIRITDLLSEVLKVDKYHYETDTAYEFSNGRKFESSDKSNSGIYE